MSTGRQLTTDVLVIGGGVGGTAAAIQAARRGVQVVLVSEFEWLGGMLTTAGVTAPDGNELLAWQTGLWGEFLRALWQRQPGGLEQAWVSFFTYEPRIGAQILADWVRELPNLTWICGDELIGLQRQGDRVVGADFQTVSVQAQITLDGTELGDALALGDIPYRWGWDADSPGTEPSLQQAQQRPDFAELCQRYPVQAPTWVVVMQDYGAAAIAPKISAPAMDCTAQFQAAWQRYGGQMFWNYGRLPGDRAMINWPHYGNDYGENLHQLVGTPSDRAAWHQAARQHSQNFAHWIQTHLGDRYGLASDTFPTQAGRLGGGAFAVQPYYRESRRLRGVATVWEPDILPQPGGQVAVLPCLDTGEPRAIAIGNYPNDHHYPGVDFPLQPKAIRWGGRWTGTPFTIPYDALVPATVDGFLVCEKNISVSHMANGATRLQPVVMGLGQAAGLAAALCVELGCQPRQLSVRSLQQALLTDPQAPAAVVPLFNCQPRDPDWLDWQVYYLDHPDRYPASGYCPRPTPPRFYSDCGQFGQWQGQIHIPAAGQVWLRPTQVFSEPAPSPLPDQVSLVTLDDAIAAALTTLADGQQIRVGGHWNRSGAWFTVYEFELS